MGKKAAVILAPGYEEGEALLTVDIIRRGGFECDAVGLLGDEVTGGHAITAKADVVFDGSLEGYDLVVLPGGYDGAATMRDHDGLIAAIQAHAAAGKLIAAICAAPIGLDRAGLLEGRRYTCYPTTRAEIKAQAEWVDELVVTDGNVITSQGPGTTFPFAYALVDALGGDGDKLREAMRYNRALQG